MNRGDGVLIVARTFVVQKDGIAPEACEDVVFPRWGGVEIRRPLRDGAPFRIAAADGATVLSTFTKLWALLLVRAYGQGGLKIPTFCEDVAGLRVRWRKMLPRQMAWYDARNVRRYGAHSTLAGLSIFPNDGGVPDQGNFEFMAYGDTCFFHLRDSAVLASWPIGASSEFTTHPALVSSLPNALVPIESSLFSARGQWRQGDTLMLMTDALAKWFLLEAESGNAPWESVRGIVSKEAFATWVASLRTMGRLDNDDTTLVVLSIESAPQKSKEVFLTGAVEVASELAAGLVSTDPRDGNKRAELSGSTLGGHLASDEGDTPRNGCAAAEHDTEVDAERAVGCVPVALGLGGSVDMNQQGAKNERAKRLRVILHKIWGFVRRARLCRR